MLWVSQFGIVGGEVREETPWVGAFPDPGRADEPSDLYVIVEPATEGSDERCEELKEAIGEVFHREKVSLTGGILRALKDAHENLREWNSRSMKEHRIAAGISCLAAHHTSGEAYLAQVAPANAVHYRDGRLAALTPTLPDADEPLGLFEEFWPQFSRFSLLDGERLLLMSPGLAGAVSNDDLLPALAGEPVDALQLLYRRGQTLENCAALLVAALPAPAGTAVAPSLTSDL